jgi:hypothetical protein
LSSGAIITFAANISGQNIVLTSGGFTMSNDVTIDGSALSNQIVINGNHSTRIFNIMGGANVLALTHCTFSGNQAGFVGAGVGGAVDNYLSTAFVTNSLLAGNTESGSPDDIYNWASSTVTIGATNLAPGLLNEGANNGSGAVIGGAPMLAALGNYGGWPAQIWPYPECLDQHRRGH